MMDMFGKLNEMKEKMEEVKSRLDTIEVQGEAGNGRVKVTATANKKINDILIDDALATVDNKEELQDLLTIATNKALENAENVAESEMQAVAGGMMPGFPGLG